MWWVGDWLNYGERKWGEMYTQAIEVTGLSYQTLRDSKWVAAKVRLSLRRDNLSFSRHKEVAGMPPNDQEAWLYEAEAEGLSREGLRKAIRKAKHEYDWMAGEKTPLDHLREWWGTRT